MTCTECETARKQLHHGYVVDCLDCIARGLARSAFAFNAMQHADPHELRDAIKKLLPSVPLCACKKNGPRVVYSRSSGQKRERGRYVFGGCMKLITERTLVREVARRWHKQYPTGWLGGPDVYKRLDALNKETATAVEVNAIIGVTGWADPGACAECGQKVSALVSFECGEDDELVLCRACLRGAMALLESV